MTRSHTGLRSSCNHTPTSRRETKKATSISANNIQSLIARTSRSVGRYTALNFLVWRQEVAGQEPLVNGKASTVSSLAPPPQREQTAAFPRRPLGIHGVAKTNKSCRKKNRSTLSVVAQRRSPPSRPLGRRLSCHTD